jgi:hypothetical protein
MDTMRSVGGFEGAAGAAEGARQSKVDRVYAALKQAIVSGELAPLTLIDKTAWSGRFEVRGYRSPAPSTGSPSRALS